MFSSKEYDLLLVFSEENLAKNVEVIDKLRTGDIIEFTGHITSLQARKSDSFSDEHYVAHLGTFTVNLTTEEHRETTTHIHKDGRYK